MLQPDLLSTRSNTQNSETMAHHFMAVCMVCLLCAEHFPCKGHVTSDHVPKEFTSKLHTRDDRALFLNSPDNIVHDSQHFHHTLPQYNTKSATVKRVKRHGDHYHVHPENHQFSENENSQNFLQQIFSHYGNSESKTMSLEEFETMLTALGMKQLLRNEPQDNCKANSYQLATVMSQNPPHKKSQALHRHDSDHAKDVHDHHHHPNELDHVESEHSHGHVKKTKQFSHDDDEGRQNITIDAETMWNICPILLYQLTSQSQIERDGCIQTELIDSVGQQQHIPSDEHEEERVLVWIYSTIAIVGVSLCGLLGVAVIPCMDKHFYHHTLQFFVALAVGTLCGDALLHLLPHVSVGLLLFLSI